MGYRQPMAERDKTVPFGAADVAPEDKPKLVRAVFERAAPAYDLMNDLMSAGVHRIWKRLLIDWLSPQPGELVVDVAGGTGDIARLFLARAKRLAERRRARPATALVCDVNEAMLKAGSREGDGTLGLIRLCGDAEALPLKSGVADAVTIAFGIRNVTHMPRALAEMRRVLKPGGRFLCLEFSHVALPGVDRLYESITSAIIPRLGEIVTGDGEPYRYLVDSIRRFPDQKRFARMIEEAGFAQVAFRNLSGGIAALHSGWRI
jgi:demethylmenaquinone methyltransferase/2-methoxy-6-polyprenyl-1,4-benzoquinol methylase